MDRTNNLDRFWQGLKYFPHPVIRKQILAPQPSPVLVIIFYAIPAWFLTLATRGLMHSPSFVHFVAEHYMVYRMTFFLLQMALWMFFAAFLICRYTTALWTPPPREKYRTLMAFLILLPLLIWHLKTFTAIPALFKMALLPDDAVARQWWADLHARIWGMLAYGTRAHGVAFSSIASFTVPAFEEILFSGLIANFFAKKIGIIAGIIVTAVCFALAHSIQFGFGMELIALFFAGITYTAIRFCSGSLLYAVLAHLFINFIIFLPKWEEAVFYFHLFPGK